MDMETADYTELDVVTETEAKADSEAETETEARADSEAEAKAETKADFEAEAETDSKTETKTEAENGGLSDENERMVSESEEHIETSLGYEKTVPEAEKALLDASEDSTGATEGLVDDSEAVPEKDSLDSYSGSSDILNQVDVFAFSEMDEEAVLDWQDNLAACRTSLASCVSLLLFGDIVLCLLLGCLCASIFSGFWKVNR